MWLFLRCVIPAQNIQKYKTFLILPSTYHLMDGPGSVVGIAIGYGLGRSGDRIPMRGEIFCTCPDRPWGPPSLLYNGFRGFSGDKERPGRDANPSSPSSAVGHERVELYLYSSYGQYSLYRASVPVQGCTLSLPYSRAIRLLPLWAVRPVQSLNACTRVHFSLFTFIQQKAELS
jgi:hypothetical protein